MALVVLANFDAETAVQLIQLLQRNRHSASLLPTGSFKGDPRVIRRIPCDLIIIDVTSHVQTARALLGEVIRRRAKGGPRPMLLCVARTYRGPRFELDLERKGARLAYVS